MLHLDSTGPWTLQQTSLHVLHAFNTRGTFGSKKIQPEKE